MAELFTNLAETVTTSAIDATTDPVTFTVSDASKFPNAVTGSVDYFHGDVDTGTNVEILRCQRSGNTITANRAQEGTAKVAHLAGVRFAHNLTASSITQIPAYVQASTLTTKGDSFVRTAAGITRDPVGADGTVEIADSSQATGKRWGSVGGGGGGAAVAWQEPDYTVYFDGTNYFARNEKTQTVDYTSPTSVHAVINSAATALGTGTNFGSVGGLIALSTPTNKVMTTQQPVILQNQVMLRGTGRGCILKVGGAAGNWSAGTLVAPKAVIDAYLKSRVIVENLSIDCSNYAGTTGIVFEKGSGNTGGNEAHSYFLFNEVRNFTVSGIQIGYKNSSGATSTAWLFGNQVVDDSGNNAVGVGFYVGDAHYGWGNNIKMASSNGYPMYVNADSVHVMGESHMVNNSNTTTHALITVVGGGHTRIEGIYFDNLNNFPAVAVNPEGSGASNRTLIVNNWCHLTSVGTYPSSPSVFTLNAVNGGCSGIVIANNIGEADDEAHRFRSIVDITNGSANDIQNTLLFHGNSFQHVNTFITADNGPTSGAGSAAVGVGQNVIESSNTGGGTNGGAFTVGP